MPWKDPNVRRAKRAARREEIRANYQAWYEKNKERLRAKARLAWQQDPEKHRARQRAEWAAKRDQKLANQRAYRLAHLEDARSWGRASRQRHLEKVRALDRERAKTPARKQQAKIKRVKNSVIIAINSKAWRKDNPVRMRELNQAAKQRARDNQELLAGRPRPASCDICNKSGRIIHFDHDHQRGHFRGWICNQCNMALGLVTDDANVLRKMIAYLERNRENTSPQLTLAV